MENKDVKRLRNEDNTESREEDVRSDVRKSDDDSKQLSRENSDGRDTSENGDEKGSDERVLTKDEQIAERYREIDETEILEEGKSSALYRRAVSDFNPRDTRVQLAEHWEYRDPEFEQKGHF